jgi:hypothetical protein
MVNRRLVGPHSGGGWQVKAPGARRASMLGPAQRPLIDRARQILKNLGGGELTVQGRRGRIRKSDTIPLGRDPFPPRDNK